MFAIRQMQTKSTQTNKALVGKKVVKLMENVEKF